MSRAKPGFRIAAGGGAAAAEAARKASSLAAETSLPTLFLAVRGGDNEAFFKAARMQPSLITARDEQGHTVLHWMALRGDLEACKTVIAMGAEVRRVHLSQPAAHIHTAVQHELTRPCISTCSAAGRRQVAGAADAAHVGRHRR